MPFDNVDAYVAIQELNEKLEFIYSKLVSKGIIKEEKDVPK